MRNDLRPRLLAGAGAVLLTLAALTGCTPTGGGGTPSEIPVTTPDPTTEPSPSASPEPPADALPNVVPAQPGDCPVDPSAHGVVTFVVTADDNSTPIDVTYSAFRPGADPEIRTVTTVGPSVVVLLSNCGNQAASAPWTFSATSATGGSLSCAAFYGGKLLKSAGDYAEGDVARGTSVDCTAHPGM